MLDGLLGRGFSSKCKSLIKATRTRIEVVRRRAEAKQRFLKEDLAKLLSNGLDINAYGRTEEFLAGLSLLSCYDFIEQSCEYVVKQLSKMQKTGECPEDCREAVSSLIFAAARFSDLPELRDLRDTFLERYGNSLECFVNQKFIEKFSSTSPTTEKRLQVLQDIASEFSIMWSCMEFEKRMAAPAPALAQATISERNIPKQRPRLLDDGKQIHNRQEGNAVKRYELNHAGGWEKTSYHKQKSLVKGEYSTSSGGHSVLIHGRQGLIEDKHLNLVGNVDISLKGVTKCSPSHRHTGDNIVGGHVRLNNGVHTQKGETIEALSCEKPDLSTRCTGFPGKSEDLISSPDHFNRKNILNSTGKAPAEETDRLKSCYSNLPPPPYIKSKDNSILPLPPYTKPKDDKHRACRGSKYGGSDFDGHFIGYSPHNRSKQVNGLGKSHKEPVHHDHEDEGKSLELVKMDSYGYKNEVEYQDNAIPLPKQRSTRRKHQKLSSNRDSVGNVDDFSSAKRSSSSRRRDHSKKGLQILFDNEHHQNDEEERVIDKLLIHYSKKPSDYDAGKVKKKLLAHSSHQRAIQRAIDAGELSLDQRRDGHDVESEIIPHPARSISLPNTESGSPQVKKVFTRANTFQPDNQARHVHPKLPDYDDLAARFGALKGH
ncbi:uncharacterized protein LOC111407889 [Olea europaea var. sylvestris]|uniref:uncharacterized protein LOC111407889 n=1 Tax=Olea europaea var. sylvestris TaxID=158386 RepID=UPI000C1D0B2C|nr:uncharacterized protein LOC111407889 [Olea europaea var. sylvestris]